MYAKNCINSTVTVEDLIFGFESRGLHWIISRLQKYFLQTMLIEKGKVLSPQASYLLQHKYPEIPCMEDVHKRAQLEVF